MLSMIDISKRFFTGVSQGVAQVSDSVTGISNSTREAVDRTVNSLHNFDNIATEAANVLRSINSILQAKLAKLMLGI